MLFAVLFAVLSAFAEPVVLSLTTPPQGARACHPQPGPRPVRPMMPPNYLTVVTMAVTERLGSLERKVRVATRAAG